MVAIPRPEIYEEAARSPVSISMAPETPGSLEMLPRRIRRDALPEHTHYADTGCEVHPSCLTCPLVRCRYDEPGGVRRLFNGSRDRQIVELQRSGDSVNAIAHRFGVSRRTVFRALARSRGGVAEDER